MLAPPGGIDGAVRFYSETVGLEQIERPETMGGSGAWFRAGRHELHVSEHDGFVAAAKAHPGFAVSSAELDALASRLAEIGANVDWDERMAPVRRFYTADPAGNRIEFLARDE